LQEFRRIAPANTFLLGQLFSGGFAEAKNVRFPFGILDSAAFLRRVLAISYEFSRRRRAFPELLNSFLSADDLIRAQDKLPDGLG
jgi:hypothetical protein